MRRFCSERLHPLERPALLQTRVGCTAADSARMTASAGVLPRQRRLLKGVFLSINFPRFINRLKDISIVIS